MKKSSTPGKQFSVYPGEFTLMPETEALMKELKDSRINTGIQPLVNVEELEDGFAVEMLIPGAIREDIFLYVKNNTLTMVMLHQASGQQKNWQMHEFDSTYTERHVLLPENADTEFASAEYKGGALRMFIPKSYYTFTSGAAKQIAIY